ncbi:MAG: acyl-CoA synthetase [Acidimicrobiales bacterium]
MSFNLAELFESVANAVGDRTAVVTPARSLTYRALDDRASRLAQHLAGAGIGEGDHIGLQLLNGTEYLEGMLAAFKLRAVPVNINHRYVERELLHLFDDADLVALVVDASFASRVAAVAPRIPSLSHIVVVGGESPDVDLDAVPYEAVLASTTPPASFAGRSGDDLYIAYTGGTTGMPKGVVWRHEDIFFAALGGGDPLLDKGPIGTPDELPLRVPDFPVTQLCAPPLMHVSAHWGAFNTFFGGGTVVLLGGAAFDGREACAAIGENGVNVLTVVGDAMARPVLDALADDPGAYDTSSLFVFASGGALLSPATKARIGELLPAVMVVDAFGSSETGIAGSNAGAVGARFTADDRTAVLGEDLGPVTPGSGEIGRIARRGHIPLRYHKDEAKTAATFVTIDGERWSLPGDMATVDDDGTIVLLGRGSGSINTGGEKVFPEEVEAVLKGHPGVLDVLVVGTPDERWGERVTAIVQPASDAMPTLEALTAFARDDLAGYKLPRRLLLVDEVRRGPNGKPDYGWAKAHAGAPTNGRHNHAEPPGDEAHDHDLPP